MSDEVVAELLDGGVSGDVGWLALVERASVRLDGEPAVRVR